MSYSLLDILSIFTKQEYNLNRNIFVTVITEIATGLLQKAVRFCFDKIIPQLLFRTYMIVDHYYSKILDLLTSTRICCIGFIVVQSMTLLSLGKCYDAIWMAERTLICLYVLTCFKRSLQ